MYTLLRKLVEPHERKVNEMTKKFEITYKNVCILFDNVFTKTLEGKTANEALHNYASEKGYVLIMLNAKEIH